MIPRIIHYCWLSGDPFPKDIAICLESWKEYLKEYELWLWGKKPKDNLGLNIVEKSIDLNSVVWCKQAFDEGKYAFAADYIRLYAVYNYGGVYLDSDVMMYKPFDDLLNLPYFLGEDAVHCFEPAIFGAEKGCQWVKDVLDWYEGRLFTNSDGTTGQCGLPVVFHDVLCAKYKFELSKKGAYSYKDDVIRIFPKEYFNSRNYIKPIQTKESYCSHHFVGSWLKKKHKLSPLVIAKRYTPDILLNMLYAVMYHFKYKKKISDVLIPFKNTNS
ncbi:MAG: glycosyl transferase [Bacteroidaceae bacterium]|nr:glycosyl transferase [Bacteroidaceae bacterium]